MKKEVMAMFSVIIPVYNGEKFIDKAIESVFNQTESHWELIIVNDGSKDNTLSVLEKYRDNEKIKIISKINEGVSVARNTGVYESKGEYVTFLDADDIWHPDHLKVMKDLIEKYPHAGFYGTFTRCELVNGEIIDECNFFKDREDDVYLEDFFEEYHKDKSAKMFTVITTCVTREAFDKAGGFPVGCKIGEDLELSLRIAAYYPVVLSNKATATYKKEYSTATKDISFDPDWGFFDGVEDIYRDESIPCKKRENIRKVMEWFSMRRFRHYLIDGRRKEAMNVYKALDKKQLSKKDVIINGALCFMPVSLVKKIFIMRWRGQA
ncbi:MAG: glycosyltransferase [Ruminococcaceae bacterium]|nr:glycosyltransferase [Oscillospiraceae bacterium]